ncbi:hypothetical protein BKA70DRAFT_1472116 [Coprinopsis sp. MPI-PUGE-AT-0042]|nr:hypothetical protein BKA70DRAFT_1472116 [Coprinopsis sp. MPI-PUGE-AT-0042]
MHIGQGAMSGSLLVLRELDAAMGELDVQGTGTQKHSLDKPTSGSTLLSDVLHLSRPLQKLLPADFVLFAETSPLVLTDAPFRIRTGEKVGIAGWTSAGKSSLLQDQFGTVEITYAQVEIDGIDTRRIGFKSLRTRQTLVITSTALCSWELGATCSFSISFVLPQMSDLLPAILSPSYRRQTRPEGKPAQRRNPNSAHGFIVGDESSKRRFRRQEAAGLCLCSDEEQRGHRLDKATRSAIAQDQNRINTATALCIALVTVPYNVLTQPRSAACHSHVLFVDQGSIAEFHTELRLFDEEGSILRSIAIKPTCRMPILYALRMNGRDSDSFDIH